ncbi:MAG TPA: POTRA domain-containing protein [Pyrinomonadaceae bacterium]|jgi:outer membrane protein assembly factor BamA|nr:POTRA domain-containing protein [Pyrinomonadaceae bacterium]
MTSIKHLTTAVVLAIIGLVALPAAAQQRQTLGRLEFVGLKRLTTEQVVAMSGLKVGQVIDANILDAAAEELLKTGLFRRLSYRVHNVGNQATVTFQVEESAVSLPVVFENFVWFSDEEILAAIRKDVLFFNGTSPASGETPDKIAAALQRLLTEKHIAGKVDYMPYVSKDKQELLFTVNGAHIPICSMHFPGATAVPEAELVKAAQPLFKSDYSQKDTATFIPLNLLPLYHHLGYLQTQFQSPSATLETGAQCAGGVNVTVPVAEGLSYHWAKSVWDGNDKLTVEDLANALGMNPGDLADGVKIDAGVKNLRKAYANRGFLAPAIQAAPEFDDAASLVTYRFKIDEGPRYFMGNLVINGLTAAEADELKSKWTLGPNAVFDESYLDQFRQGPLQEFMRTLMQRSRTSVRFHVEIEQKPDRQKLTVDVLINFKPGNF